MRFGILALMMIGCGGSKESAGTEDITVDHLGGEATVDALAPRTCVSEEGKIYVVWYDARNGDNGIFFNASSDAGASWMPSDAQLNKASANAINPTIGCAGDRVYVVWEDARDGELAYQNIYANVSDDGGRTWLEEDILLDGDIEGLAMSLSPQVVAVGDSAYVAWFDARNGAYDIYLQATTDGGETWLDEATRVDTDDPGEAYSAEPRLVADGKGNVVVVWEDRRNGASDIYANYSEDDGRSFSSNDQRLDGGDDAGATNSFFPRVSMEDDSVYVTWHDERSGELHDVLINASFDHGQSWRNEALIVESNGEGNSDALNPALTANGGKVYVAWQDDRSGGYDIYYRISADGGETWEAEEARVDTDAPGEFQSYNATIHVDGESILIGWEDRRNDALNDGTNDLFYNYSDNGGKNWSGEDIRINSTEPGLTYAVDLGLYRQGDQIYAIWADGRFTTSHIYFAGRKVGEPSVYVEPEKEEE